MKAGESKPTLQHWAQRERAAVGIAPWWASVLDALPGVKLAAETEAELLEALDVLGSLRADEEMLAACVLYTLQQSEAMPTSIAIDGIPHLRDLIDGQQAAEKVWSLYAARSAHASAEGLRRLLLAIIRDLRVVFILLARQLAALRRAAKASPERQRDLAQLSADIHAPLANRLGIWQLKWELEDLAFRYLQPDVYRRIAALLDERRDQRTRYISGATAELKRALKDSDIEADVAGRPKHIYSIWKKMQRKGGDFSSLYDIRALRVLVKDVPACYAALGAVHTLWPPVPSEFDDYIARPKGNHYQSLHTAVVGPEGKTLEVQIRSFDMHAHAERGVAAHWRYKEGGGDQDFERKIAWMRGLLETKEDSDDGSALLAGFKTDILEDRVYLLTPQGQVIDLPRGATVLDFAYTVHTDVGHRTRGAKVNGRIVPLNFQPASGDRIEILTGKTKEPRRDWLSTHHAFLTTHRAQQKVRTWFKRVDHDANIAAGRVILEKELKRLAMHNVDLDTLPPIFGQKNLDDFLVALALGEITAGHVARALHEAMAPPPQAAPVPVLRPPKRGKDAVTIEGVGNLLTTLARCCQPLPGDPIVGYITRGKGVSIHRADCASFARLRARDANRAIDVEWGTQRDAAYEVDVLVKGYDRKWLHKDVTNVIAAANVHMIAANARVDSASGLATMNFALRVADYEQLSMLLGRLSGVPNVIEARRLA